MFPKRFYVLYDDIFPERNLTLLQCINQSFSFSFNPLMPGRSPILKQTCSFQLYKKVFTFDLKNSALYSFCNPFQEKPIRILCECNIVISLQKTEEILSLKSQATYIDNTVYHLSFQGILMKQAMIESLFISYLFSDYMPLSLPRKKSLLSQTVSRRMLESTKELKKNPPNEKRALLYTNKW